MPYRGRLTRLGRSEQSSAASRCAGVVATACTQGKRTQHGKPMGVVRDDQPDAREGQAGRSWVAERFVVPMKPGNAGGLAGADEERTLARLRGLRSDLIDPAIAAHHGRVVKRTGDGVLIEFRSVVDALRCAIEIQNGMVERNAGLPPERRIEFRIGIHVGDVVEENDGDLMGDGVNIAARLEGVAKPGAICLSEDAYRQARDRVDLAVNDLGPTQLKNIAEPIRIYSLEIGVSAEDKSATPEKPSPPP